MHEETRRRMAALADLHYEWSRRHHAEAQLRTNSADDYSVHHLDVDPPVGADDEFVRRAREIEGYDPDTGEYLTR